MSTAAGTTRDGARFESALAEFAIFDVIELMKSEAKRGPRSTAWKLPEAMLAHAVYCRIDPTCTFEQTLERVAGLGDEMALRSVSEKSLQRFVSRAMEVYTDLKLDDAKRLRQVYENLMPGVTEAAVREMGARALRIAGIAKLAALDPDKSSPLDHYAAAAMVRSASEAELSEAKAKYADARTREVESKINQAISKVRDGLLNESKNEYTTEDVDNITQDIAQRIGEEFRKLAEGDTE